MSSRLLGILAVVAALVAIAAIWLSGGRQAETSRGDGNMLLPSLQGRLNDVERVQVSQGGDSVTLVRGDTGWSIAERGGYPADVSQLRRGLIAIERSRILEPKTSNPDNYDQLGVADPERDGATSTQVDIQLPDAAASLIVGERASRGQAATYVRRPGEDQSWLAAGDLTLAADPASWLVKDVIDIPAREVRRVTLTHPGGERVELVKSSPDDPNFLLVDLPEGRDLLSPSAGNSVAGALSSLRLEDVMPAAEIEPETEPVLGRFETFDGVVVETRAWQQGEDRYLALEVSYEPPAVPEASDAEGTGEGEPTPAPEESTDATVEPPAEAVDSTAEQVEDAAVATAAATDADDAPAAEPEVDPSEQAQQMQQRVADWVFRIPSYKYANLTKDLESLLKPLE